MQDTGNYMSKLTSQEVQLRGIRACVWGVVAIVFIFFSSTAGCVMHNKQYEAANIAASTKQIQAQNEVEKAENDAIIKLVETGTNPIAARCAIKGKEDNSDLCAVFVNIENMKKGEELR